MIRARLVFSLLSGFALLATTGCAGRPRGPVTASPTTYELQIDAYHDPNLGFLIVVSPPGTATPAPAGSVIDVHGSLTYTPGPQPTGVPMLAGWTCDPNGTWASFNCTKRLSAPLRDDEGGYIPLAPPPAGVSESYTVTVSMANTIYGTYSFP